MAISSKPIKILITIDWFIPGTASGGPVRSIANLISHLNEGFEFYILTRNVDYKSDIPYQDIASDNWVSFNSYTKIHYISSKQLSRKNIKQLLNEKKIDIAFVNGIYSWYFSILPVLLLKSLSIPTIISARGMLNSQAFSVKPFKKKVFLRIARSIKFYKKVSFHATHKDEEKYIHQQLGENTNVHIAPNLPRKLNFTDLKHETNNPRKWVSLGRISKEKGILTLLQFLQKTNTECSLDLFGPIYDVEYWHKCQKVIKALPKNVKVAYKGTIESEKVPLVLKNYDFFISLSEGENFGHAILEALSAGLPILISTNTPWKNLAPKKVGWDVHLEHNEIKKAFIEAIEMNDLDYIEWSNAAFKYAKEFIENPKVIEQNIALFLKN
jgi:glycosyltransferase involved in cell wall biosynthesis